MFRTWVNIWGGGGTEWNVSIYMQPVNFARCTSPACETERVDESWGGGGVMGILTHYFSGVKKKILDHAPVGQYSESVYFRVPIHVVQCHIIGHLTSFFLVDL